MSSSFITDWSALYSRPLRPRRAGMPMASPTGGVESEPAIPDASWTPAWYRDQLPETAFNPQLESSGPAGLGAPGPSGDTSISAPRAGAASLLNGSGRMPPPGSWSTPSAGGLGGAPPAGPPVPPLESSPEPPRLAALSPPPIPARSAPPPAPPAPPAPEPELATSEREQDLAPSVAPMPVPSGEPPSLAEQSRRAAERVASTDPGPLRSNWGQRLALAALSMTRLAPIANQLVHPKYSARAGEHARALAELEKLSKSAEDLSRADWMSTQSAEQKGRYLRAGNGIWDNQLGRWVEAPRDKSTLVAIPAPKAQAAGLDITTAENGVLWVPPAVANQLIKPAPNPATAPMEVGEAEGKRLGIVPEIDEAGQPHYLIPKEGISSYISSTGKPPSAPTAEARAQEVEALLGKMYQAGEFALTDATDLGKLGKALSASKVLSPGEKASIASHYGLKTSPASTGTAATIRVEGYQQGRVDTYLDTQKNEIVSMNVDEFNGANRAEPGRFVQASKAIPVSKQQAQYEDIQYNIDNTRSAIQALGTIDAGTRAQLANMLADEDTDSLRGKISTFLSGSVGSTMTRPQQNAVIALKNLFENALILRNIAGMGQGSDQLRRAITNTLPSAKSPDVPYMLRQIDQFEGIIQRLRLGTPNLPGAPARPAPAAPGGAGGGNRDEILRRLRGGK